MKNIYTYISVAVVMLVMMVASAFLLTAADAPVRAAGGYVTLIFGAIATWATAKALLGQRGAPCIRSCAQSRLMDLLLLQSSYA